MKLVKGANNILFTDLQETRYIACWDHNTLSIKDLAWRKEELSYSPQPFESNQRKRRNNR